MLKTVIRKVIPRNSFPYRVGKRFLSLFSSEPVIFPIHKVLAWYGRENPDAFCIQVGSNDGKGGDPLSELFFATNWKGILVEPVPYLFEKLKSNYSAISEKMIFVNAAISNERGTAPFWRLKESDDPTLPFFYDQLGSFRKEVVLEHKAQIPQIESLLMEDKVKTILFADLLTDIKRKKIDILHIDTEGYDFEILKMAKIETLNLDLILFEHSHLSPADWKASWKMLRDAGFSVFKWNGDTLGVKKEFAYHFQANGEVV